MKIPKEIIEYVREIASGKSAKEIARLVNDKYSEKIGMSYSTNQIRGLMNRNKIRSGYQYTGLFYERYGPEFDQFIRDNVDGKTSIELTALVQNKFDKDITVDQIKAYKKKRKYKSGLDFTFKPGNKSWCDGKKGRMPEGWGSTGRFQKGNVPYNYSPVGTETINKEGYIVVKVRGEGTQRDRWKFKHLMVWESVNGPIEKGYVITFLDGNRANCDISNLAKISVKEHLEMNRNKLRFNDPELTSTGINIARLNVAIRKKKRGGSN